MSQNRGLSVCPSGKHKSIVSGHSSAFQASPTNPCMVRQVPKQLHQLCRIVYSSISSLLTHFSPAWMLLYYRPHVCFFTIPGHMAKSSEEQTYLHPHYRQHGRISPGSWLLPPGYLLLSLHGDHHGCLLL